MNILYLLTDQMRFDALSCNGAPVCRTPEIDRLAQHGTNFTSAYSVNALCTPARASIVTGLYPHMHGQLSNMGNFNGVFDRQVLRWKGYSHYLKKGGYQTGYIGKWHLPEEGNKEVWSFDAWDTDRDYDEYLKKKGIDYDMGVSEVQHLEWGEDAAFCGPSVLSAEDHHDGWVAAGACRMLEDFAGGEKPFMICAAFHGPHFPYAVPKPFCDSYRPEDVPRWENFNETFRDKPVVQQKELMRWNTAQLTWIDWQKVIAAYWGYCSYLDSLVGKIMSKLEHLGLAEDTMVVFSTDHGDMLGSHRLFNKGFNMYEEDHHIPLIISCPGKEEGITMNPFVNTVDLMPTFLDAAGCPVPEEVQGKSLMSMLEGEVPQGWRQESFSEFNGYESTLLTSRMVRTRKWKYVYNPFGQDELYDMESDPGELYNLAELQGFVHVLRRMRKKMLGCLTEYKDSIAEVTSWQSNSYSLFVSDREE